MQNQDPENTYARMPFLIKLIEMGWKEEPIPKTKEISETISSPHKEYFQ